MARYHRSRLQALPPRGHEALPQGRALLHREVRRTRAGRIRRASTARRRIKLSEYAIRLREKQKVRRIYGVARAPVPRLLLEARAPEGPHRRADARAARARLDNVVHRLGFAFTAEARQLVRHGHILVNGKRVDIPSYLLRAGDKIEVRRRAARSSAINASLAQVDKRPASAVARARQGELHGHLQGRCRSARS